MDIPRVRFDDLSPGGSGSFGLLDPGQAIVANRQDDVIPALLRAEQAANDGNWVAGFVAYEAAPAFDEILSVRPPGLHDPMRDLPLVHFQVFGRRVELDDIDSVHVPAAAYNVSAWNADSTQHEYKEDLAMIGRSLMAGEIGRLTHTIRLHAAFGGDPAALYRDLLLSQRGAHAACIDVGRFRIVSASPAGFFRRAGNTLTVRPVLATARRGRWLDEDLHFAGTLQAEGDESYTNRMVMKELEAELAEIGDIVRPTSLDRFTVERFETLWQLTAEIQTQLSDAVGIVDVFAALFPAVSTTGVPKPEAMKLIARTEETPRGIYCGAIGFLGPAQDGVPQANFSVAVRTVVVDEEEGVAEFGVGTAITNRSDVVSAYEEARLKAKVLVDRRPDFQLYEDMRVDEGVVGHAAAKVSQLVESARYFGFPTTESLIRDALDIARNAASGSQRIRIVVDREGAVWTEAKPAPEWCGNPDSPFVLIGTIVKQPVSSDNVFLFHNTTDSRLGDALARQYPDADVVVLVNQDGEVAGSLDGNIVIRSDNRWVTPSLSCGTVGCALRAELLASGDIEEGCLTQSDLVAAERVALIDDIHGWRAIGLVG